MNLRQLVGKKVIRTKPYMDKNLIHVESLLVSNDRVVELPDYSFCDCHTTMIEVLEVVQDTPIVKIRGRKGNVNQEFDDGYIRSISGEYDDDNWKDITEVYPCMNKFESEIKKEKENKFIKRMLTTLDYLYARPHDFPDAVLGSIIHNMLDKSSMYFGKDLKEDINKKNATQDVEG